MASRLRWLVLSIFVLSTALNYLDRLLLAALAPTLKSEFHLSNTQYGGVISVFSIVYALTAPVAGWFTDRVGLNAGITVSMAVWSLAGMATGLTRSFGGLLASRTVLGIGEAAGIPCAGKANGVYLQPRELAFGTALNQVGITIGSIAAPLMVAVMAPVYGWRSVFVVCGALGFVWIPVWWLTTTRLPAKPVEATTTRGGVVHILKDRRIWGLAAANALVMTLYTLWTNWTTLYFVEQYHLSEIQANERFVWIPTVFATLGGFAGGWMAFRSIKSGRHGSDVLRARLRICWLAAGVLLLTAAVPLMPTPGLAAALISFSFFWCLAISTNLYAMPIDFFGAGHAAFGVSILTASYGLMQTVLSPLIGSMVDHFGFPMVCVSLSVMPLAGIGILRASTR
jgi:ACS family hexuronate transporter-like MFS transporter